MKSPKMYEFAVSFKYIYEFITVALASKMWTSFNESGTIYNSWRGKRDLPQGFLSGERGGGKGANSS